MSRVQFIFESGRKRAINKVSEPDVQYNEDKLKNFVAENASEFIFNYNEKQEKIISFLNSSSPYFLFLIGPTGCGKRSIVEKIISRKTSFKWFSPFSYVTNYYDEDNDSNGNSCSLLEKFMESDRNEVLLVNLNPAIFCYKYTSKNKEKVNDDVIENPKNKFTFYDKIFFMKLNQLLKKYKKRKIIFFLDEEDVESVFDYYLDKTISKEFIKFKKITDKQIENVINGIGKVLKNCKNLNINWLKDKSKGNLHLLFAYLSFFITRETTMNIFELQTLKINNYVKTKATRSKKTNDEKVKEIEDVSSFNFFHLVGKFCYNKRICGNGNEEKLSKDLLLNTKNRFYYKHKELLHPYDTESLDEINDYLIENSHHFFKDITEHSNALETFSFTNYIHRFETNSIIAASSSLDRTLLTALATTEFNLSLYNSGNKMNRYEMEKPIDNYLRKAKGLERNEMNKLYNKHYTGNTSSIPHLRSIKKSYELYEMMKLMNRVKISIKDYSAYLKNFSRNRDIKEISNQIIPINIINNKNLTKYKHEDDFDELKWEKGDFSDLNNSEIFFDNDELKLLLESSEDEFTQEQIELFLKDSIDIKPQPVLKEIDLNFENKLSKHNERDNYFKPDYNQSSLNKKTKTSTQK